MRVRFGLCTGLWAITLVLALASCEREQRQFRAAPWMAGRSDNVRARELRPGSPLKPPEAANAYAIAEGQRLFRWFNCVGCHAHGGGGIGPPLMGALMHGREAATIFAIIIGGTPNGMPAFGDKIPDAQVWQLVAYVRSLSGLASRDAAPARNDHLQGLTSAPPPPSTRGHAPLAELRAAEDAALHSYGWVDRATGIVRIPIDRAMEVLAARGLPVRAQPPEAPARPPAPEQAR
jgi:cytochrome c oxidase cbb3-type subunit III